MSVEITLLGETFLARLHAANEPVLAVTARVHQSVVTLEVELAFEPPAAAGRFANVRPFAVLRVASVRTRVLFQVPLRAEPLFTKRNVANERGGPVDGGVHRRRVHSHVVFAFEPLIASSDRASERFLRAVQGMHRPQMPVELVLAFEPFTAGRRVAGERFRPLVVGLPMSSRRRLQAEPLGAAGKVAAVRLCDFVRSSPVPLEDAMLAERRAANVARVSLRRVAV